MHSTLTLLLLSSFVSTAVLATPEPWEAWYTVTLPSGLKYGYYSEKLESRSGKFFFTQTYLKKEEDYINEEQVGVVTDKELKPLFFNFRSKFRNSETIADGAVQDGTLTVKVRKDGKESTSVKKKMPSRAFFSVFFPVWLNENLPKRASESWKPKKKIAFEAVFEDRIETNFAPVAGQITLESPDDFATLNRSRKISLSYGTNKSVWWIDDTGRAIKIQANDYSVIQVTKEKAEAFFKERKQP